MKKLLIGFCLLVFSVGCTPEKKPTPPEFRFNLGLRRGQKVDLKLGIIGHIVDIDFEGRRYKVRVNTPNGGDVWLREADVKVVIE